MPDGSSARAVTVNGAPGRVLPPDCRVTSGGVESGPRFRLGGAAAVVPAQPADEIEARLTKGRAVVSLVLDAADGARLSWLYEHCEILVRDMQEDGALHLTVRVPAEKLGLVQARFAQEIQPQA